MIDMYVESIEDFTTVTKKNSKNAHAYFRWAFSYKAMKEYDKAAEDFETAK